MPAFRRRRRIRTSTPVLLVLSGLLAVLVGAVAVILHQQVTLSPTSTGVVKLGDATGSSPPETVRLIPAISLTRPLTATGPSLGRVFRPFPHRSAVCGHPTHHAIRSSLSGSVSVRQRTVRCRLAAVVRFTRVPIPTPKPAPSATIVPRPAPSPTRPAPTPILTVVRPTPVPTPVSCSGQDCAAAAVVRINADRAAVGAAPLTLSAVMSAGASSCLGALGHSQHMAATDVLAHDQFPSDVCPPWTTAGENIGDSGGAVWPAFLAIHAAMMAEPWSADCTGNHHCNLLSPSYRRIGVGFARSAGGIWYLTEDFAG